MADEGGSLKSIADIVPNVYYDLIARVCSGVPFLILVLWSDKDSFKDVMPDTGANLLLLIGAGYLTGMLLTPVSLTWNAIIMPLAHYLLDASGLDWRRSELNEEIGVKHKQGFLNLEKMQAEATLCQNLLSGYVILFVLNLSGAHSVQLFRGHGPVFVSLIFLLLLTCAVFLTLSYVRRQDIVHRLHVPQKH